MRKLMYLFASMAIAVIFATGCASADSESKADNGTDKTEKTETTDTKKELLQTQMDFTADFSTYYGPIAAYQAAAADEATTEDELNTAAESAKKAADEGAAKLADYKLESNLPGEQKEAYTKSLDSLKSYFEEISKSLDASAAEPNFDAAQKHFDTFQSELEGIYKEADLNVPDMAQALS